MDTHVAEQLKERVAFFNMAGDEDYYPYVRNALSRIGDESLDKFYRMISAQPHLRDMFSSQEAMNGARRAQVAHWQHLFTGRPTPEYAVRAQHIGKVHSKIGLEPRWYIGGYANVLADVIVHLVKSSPYGRLPGMERLASTLVALIRAAMLDMEIAVSTYFDAEQEMRNEMLSKFGDVLGRMAQGDLTVSLPQMQGQFGELATNFNSAVRQLHEAMAAVAYSVEHIHSGSDEIRVASDDFAVRTERQSASLEETAAAMSEVTGMIQQGASQTASMNATVTIMQKEIAEGGEVVASAVQAMDQIHQSSSEIAQIIDVIEGIAFQTNLLALNAGVEAARAGDAGQGFAVVASEVRALAQRSSDAAQGIKDLISKSGAQVEKGVSLVGRAGTVLQDIVTRINEMSGTMQELAAAAVTQAETLDHVNAAVGDMDRMTQQNAAMAEQSNAASRTLAVEADSLSDQIKKFRVALSTNRVRDAAKGKTGYRAAA
ncbi:globin-coupled sensor protein [Sphingobium fluviale]|uniref:Globin-coupled sensor protein n=1 Tax=Sphingobium fluviale TaxID=2506423 RepID=A0A4Q1KG34_9SPHN|nr:globin-coupled sensor protein [Sphingobium fluviale]RXR28631.1 globin-coupled sensor protein [Sphingobium fluviale]